MIYFFAALFHILAIDDTMVTIILTSMSFVATFGKHCSAYLGNPEEANKSLTNGSKQNSHWRITTNWSLICWSQTNWTLSHRQMSLSWFMTNGSLTNGLLTLIESSINLYIIHFYLFSLGNKRIIRIADPRLGINDRHSLTFVPDGFFGHKLHVEHMRSVIDHIMWMLVNF